MQLVYIGFRVLKMPVTNPELLSQIHLSGEAACPRFQPHPLKANICTACSKLVNKHSAESIPDDECLMRVRDHECLFVAELLRNRTALKCLLLWRSAAVTTTP